MADELLHRLQSIPDPGRSYVVTGGQRLVRVVADPARLARHSLDLAALTRAIDTNSPSNVYFSVGANLVFAQPPGRTQGSPLQFNAF